MGGREDRRCGSRAEVGRLEDHRVGGEVIRHCIHQIDEILADVSALRHERRIAPPF
jgi:hypothetical protein